MIRIGFGVYSTIIIIKNSQNPILIIKAPTLFLFALHLLLAVARQDSALNGERWDLQPY